MSEIHDKLQPWLKIYRFVYEKDAEMAVKEIEMIELEVEESKKTKMSLEQELTKMHQHYEETVLRANERNRSLQSELENMKNKQYI